MPESSNDKANRRVSRRDFLKYLGPATGIGAAGLAGGLVYVSVSQVSRLDAQDSILESRLESEQFRTTLLESLSHDEPYRYLVYSDAETPRNYFAKNGSTGRVERKETSLVTVLNHARDNLTSGRSFRERICLKGDFVLDGKFSLPELVELDLRQANLAAAGGLSADMIEAGVEDFAIVGGRLDGSGQAGGSLIRVLGGAQRFWIGYGMRLLKANQNGIHVEGTSQYPVGVGTIADVDVELCGHDGIFLGPFSADNIVSRVNCGVNGAFGRGSGSGIELSSSSDNVLSDVLVWNNAAQGLDVFQSLNNSFTNVRADYNYAHGVRLAGSSGNVLLNLRCHDNGSLNPGGVFNPLEAKYSGVKIEDSVDNVVIGGVSQNTRIDPGFNVGLQAYGVDETGSSDQNIIAGVNVGKGPLGNNLSGIVRSGVNTRVSNCPGFNPQGIEAIPVSSAGPLTYVNLDGVSEAIYIQGGTVSDISKDGTTLFTSTPATIWLEPNESVTVNYSLAPTTLKDRK